MRIAFGLAGLALSVLAIGACGEPDYKEADAVTCMAYLALQSAAVSEGRSAGDAATLDAAGAAWRTLAEQKYSADELAQFFASSVAVFDDVAAPELAQISTACLSHAPTV
ncbi:hypothetical protein [Candidatus Viadribacter manganicus]|uniref:Lipoprotein n=1 Tax=Candidatus Viadribacter manganicus TaxID=1759059 RepID=A0A1B1AKZ6_9PROT|nr:hypothetical protein [Candidatus Viadribacter manganicus]ANP47223.1 hypothetical protein ATE48_15495 [Candidatus Viadribacter manganicus]